MTGKKNQVLKLAYVWMLMPFFAGVDTAQLKAADYFQICRKTDPNLNDCIKTSIEKLLPTLKNGIPDLGMNSIDPMLVSKLNLVQGSGPISLDSTFLNTSIEGITRLAVKSVTADLDRYTVDIEVAVPYLFVSGDYVIRGHVLVLPILGSGDSWSNYTDVTAKASLIGHPETRDGKEYMRLDEFRFGIQVKGAKIQMNNLFGGNKQLGDVMNRLLSDNWALMFAELKPAVDKAIGRILKDVAEKVFDQLPLGELFPN